MGLLLESSMTEALIAVLTVVLLLYRYLTSRFDYWQKAGLPCLRPQPFFGNIRDVVLMRTSNVDLMHRLYREGAPHKAVGFFFQSTPALLIRDPELVKSIIIKDFSHFPSRFQISNSRLHPMANNLFFVESRRWRPLRIKLSPTFSSGRIKAMFPLLAECAATLQQAVAKQVSAGQRVIEMRDALAKFSTDVIGTCAFGLQCNAIQDADSPFRAIGRKLFQPRLQVAVLRFLVGAFPFLNRLRPNFTTDEVANFFLKLVRETVEERSSKGITRNDFLQLLIQIKEKGHLDGDGAFSIDNEEPIEFTDELMTAQCLVFFAAGFETSSTTMSFALHELALNQDVQDRLRREVDAVMARHGGQLTYEGVHEMTYLDQVVAETLRLYPALPWLDRVCELPYKIPGTDVTIEPGIRVLIPVPALQRDPLYFPEPDCFDPERFNEANRDRVNKGAYLPFGDGPRNCIGMRFGLLQSKVGLAALLSRFRVAVSTETNVPPRLAPLSFVTMPVGGVKLKVEPRDPRKA